MNNSSYDDFDIGEFRNISIVVLLPLINIVNILMLETIFWFERFETNNTRNLTNNFVVLVCYNGLFCALVSFFLIFYYTILPLCHMLHENQ